MYTHIYIYYPPAEAHPKMLYLSEFRKFTNKCKFFALHKKLAKS